MFWRTTILLLIAVVNGILFYRMIWSNNGLLSFSQLQMQHTILVQELAQFDEENMRLSKKIRLLQSNDAYVEKMIRQRLHYVRDNEILYLFTKTSQNQHNGDTSHEGKN